VEGKDHRAGSHRTSLTDYLESTTTMTHPILTVITPSYHNDYELVIDLCASLDQFLKVPFKHIIIVPRADLGMFAGLGAANRTVLAEEDLLRPYGFRKIPFFKRIRIPGLIDKKIREQWYRFGAGRTNGWVIQQLLKISAVQLTDTDLIMFADSDNILFRPLELEQLYKDGKIKLSRSPMRADMHNHRQWHANGRELLGITDFKGEPYNYIGNLIVWQREAVLGLQRRIEQVTGLDWRVALARKKAVSEYIFYGLYCEFLAENQGGHSFGAPDLTCSFWTNDADFTVSEMAKSLQPSHVALHIQSTIPMPLEKRRDLIAQLAARVPAAA
jgi:hypothetical protein